MCFHNIVCLFVCISSSAVVWLLCAILFIPFDELDFLFMGVFSVLFLQTSAALHLSPLSRKIWKHIFLKNASLLVCKIPFLHSLTVEWMDKMETLSAVLAVACFWLILLFLPLLFLTLQCILLGTFTPVSEHFQAECRHCVFTWPPMAGHGSEPQCKWSPYKFWFK